MFRRNARVAAVVTALITVATGVVVTAGGVSSSAATKPNAGPDSCAFITELINRDPNLSMKDAARVYKTTCGYRVRSGQQNSHLVIKQVGNKLRFVDRNTHRIDLLPAVCNRIKGVRGIGFECPIGSGYGVNNRMLIEVWPRLGNDFVDGSSLSAMFSMSVLGDAGNDTALMGDGPDFFNGAFNRDRVVAGGGNDWIRSGDGHDRVRSGAGADFVTSGGGDDFVEGGDGPDQLYCGPGRDTVARDGTDPKVIYCEATR
jgi:hypothetical protein